MKTNEEYLQDYRKRYKEFEEKGELWRLNTTEEEFMAVVERKRVIWDNRKGRPYQALIELSVRSGIALALQGKVTYEEMKAQAQRVKLRTPEKHSL